MTTTDLTPIAHADVLAARLHTPPPVSAQQPWRAQSLADGAAGIALLHLERAHTGRGDWHTADAWLRAATTAAITADDDTGLYYGAPALSFLLNTADTGAQGRYHRARDTLQRATITLTHRRVDHAEARLARGDLPAAAEFDVIRGLTGIGAHLLRHHPGDDALGRVLAYLVRLTRPLRHDGILVPGWWTGNGPSGVVSPVFSGGHGNLGMAHGITGPLALLALALRRGIVVDEHAEAIARICAWLDGRRRDRHGAWWWPQWVTLQEHRTGRVHQRGPLRPSWCYGTPGIARAQQLAGIATGDLIRQRLAEQALVGCLADAAQLDSLVDASLCHGWAGLLHTVGCCARDATTTDLAEHLPALTDRLVQHLTTHTGTGDSFLEGDAGAALALHAATTAPHSGWNACLLLT